MTELDLPTALEQLGFWLGRHQNVTSSTFDIAESLRNLCFIDGIQVLPHGAGETTSFAVFRNTGDAGEWLWTMTFAPGRANLMMRSCTSQPASRVFLASLLCEAYAIPDADELLRWWSVTSKGRPRTILSPLSDSLDDIREILGQLERATIEASQSIHPHDDQR